VPFHVDVSWNAPRPLTEIALGVDTERGSVRWENVGGSFFRFRTLLGQACLLERETRLRDDTLRAFAEALARGAAPAVDPRIYDVLARAYRAAG
jgi:hypothetical protein